MWARFFGVWMVMAGVAAGGQTVVRPPVQSTLVDGHPAYPAPLTTSEAVLEEMTGRAAVIFAGTVTAVRMPEDSLSGVVEVDFAVSDAVRGVIAGTYVVREWAGLWRDGARYRVGDRRLMLLHAPGPGGLSSPVDGLDGAIPVGVDASVDMRWLGAKTLRGVNYAVAGREAVIVAAETKTRGLGDVTGLMRGWEARRNAGR